MSNNLEYEKRCIEEGYANIAGVDEAGRGPLAGPVTVCAVIMPLEQDKIIDGVTDSKKLSNLEKQWAQDAKIPKDVKTENRPRVGLKNAKVQIVAFSDFTCTYCRRAERTVEQLIKEYSGKVSGRGSSRSSKVAVKCSKEREFSPARFIFSVVV